MTVNLIHKQPGHQHLLAVAGKYYLTLAEIRSGRKVHAQARARRELWFRLVIIEGYSYPMAAKLTGGRHHTTVLSGLRKYARQKLGTPLKARKHEIRAAYLASLEQEKAA